MWCYLDFLEKQGIGVDGRLTKVERVCTALKHYNLEVIDEDDYMLAGKLGRALDHLSTIKTALWPGKQQKRHAQMEALSNTPLSLEDISAVVDNVDIWVHFDRTAQDCKRGKVVSNHDLTLTTAALAALLTFKNWQRPGAAANLKVSEVNQATQVDVQGQQLLVIKVKNTRRESTAPQSSHWHLAMPMPRC